MENEWANDTDRYALAAHPGKSQGPPPNLTGSQPIVHTGVPDCVLHNKNPPVPGDPLLRGRAGDSCQWDFHAPNLSSLATVAVPACRQLCKSSIGEEIEGLGLVPAPTRERRRRSACCPSGVRRSASTFGTAVSARCRCRVLGRAETLSSANGQCCSRRFPSRRDRMALTRRRSGRGRRSRYRCRRRSRTGPAIVVSGLGRGRCGGCGLAGGGDRESVSSSRTWFRQPASR